MNVYEIFLVQNVIKWAIVHQKVNKQHTLYI